MSLFDTKQLDTCTFCPRLCRHVCPTAIGEAKETLIPTHKMGLIKLWQQNAIALDQELAEVFYACTDCGACTSSCKHSARPAEALYLARRDAIENHCAPPEVTALLERHKEHGNPYGALTSPTVIASKKSSSTKFLPGCASLYHQPDTVPQLHQAIQQTQPERVGLCDATDCCGAALYASGDHRAHTQHARQFVEKYKGINSLIVGDPHCARHIQTRYPQTGIHPSFEVVHLLHALKNLPLQTLQPSLEPVFYHDAAPLGRHSGIYDLPRTLLTRLHSTVIEFTRNRFLALDSAAGGIYRWTSPKGAERNAQWLLDEVRQYAKENNVSSPPPLVVTVGETERSHLAQSNPDLIVKDLHQMLASALSIH